MTIEFSCAACQRPYRVKDELAGKRAKCQQCGEIMHIPDLAVVPSQAYAEHPVSSTSPGPAASGQVDETADVWASEAKAKSDYDFDISQRPDFALVTVRLREGQKIFAEPGSMATMDPTITLKAGFKGGIGKTLGRALGGESLIINTYTATGGAGEVTFAPGPPGDTAHYRLETGSFFLQRGAFMLHGEGVELTGKWQGAKGFFSGEGLVLLRATGTGDIFFNSYGAILQIDVADEYIVDTGYIVAFEDTLQYRISVLPGLRAGGKLKSLFFGGEGLVCRFSGQGRVWIQTRYVHSFLSWVHPFRPVKQKG